MIFLSAGDVHLNAGDLVKLTDIWKYVSSRKSIARSPSNRKIQVSFKMSPVGSILRPYVSVCYGKLELPLTYSEKEMENAWVSALSLHGPQGFSAS